MKIVSEDAGFKLELTIPDELKRKGMSDEEANMLVNVAYKSFIDKITSFLAYSIGRQDLNAIETISQTITNIAKSRLMNR